MVSMFMRSLHTGSFFDWAYWLYCGSRSPAGWRTVSAQLRPACALRGGIITQWILAAHSGLAQRDSKGRPADPLPSTQLPCARSCAAAPQLLVPHPRPPSSAPCFSGSHPPRPGIDSLLPFAGSHPLPGLCFRVVHLARPYRRPLPASPLPLRLRSQRISGHNGGRRRGYL
jgi:hypothetical protein